MAIYDRHFFMISLPALVCSFKYVFARAGKMQENDTSAAVRRQIIRALTEVRHAQTIS
jgi:hypothetical protein